MKTPSPYPILDNRPIDQWKVTELKEELKRRKLTIKGLKEDLIKRLDEAIQNEEESTQQNIDNSFDGTSQSVVEPENTATVLIVSETNEDMMDHGSNRNEGNADNGFDCTSQTAVETQDTRAVLGDSETTEDIMDYDSNRNEVKCDQPHVDDSTVPLGEGNIQEGDATRESEFDRNDKIVFHTNSLETSITVKESVVSEIAVNVQELQDDDSQIEKGDLKSQMQNEERNPSEDVKPNSSDPNNQVSEVSTVLGFQVKSDSISSDCVSIDDKNELKDNIIADSIKLELDVKPEMVQPSSSNILPDVDKVHLMDVEEPRENMLPVEERDDHRASNEEMSKKNKIADVVSSDDIKPEMVQPSSSKFLPGRGKLHPMDVQESHESKVTVKERDDDKAANEEMSEKDVIAGIVSSEKLNLDRSSGDDSMEDDASENKQMDFNSDEVGDKSERTDLSLVKENAPVDIMQDYVFVDKKDILDENKNVPAAPIVKRKLLDQEVVGNNEAPKRQRRWNSENIKLPEPQSNPASSMAPKESLLSSASKRNFSRSDSTASEDAPKDRVVPPPVMPPTNALRIDRFLRPFTLKAVQEFLGKTGTITGFWMDHIKTHCYVTYSSVEEAIETRNAVYNLQWPPNGGRLLIAEFVDPQEVKVRVEAPPQSLATPVNTAPAIPPPATPNLQPPSASYQQAQRQQQQQQLPPPPPLPLPPPPPPSLPNPPPARERLQLPPPPPPPPEKVDTPIVTLDDLFRKTKATPRIYYLPLSDEQVAAKLKAQGKSTKQ